MNQLVPFRCRLSPPGANRCRRRARRLSLSRIFYGADQNPNTRRAYARAVGDFLAWLEKAGIASIVDVASLHVAAYVEDLGRRQVGALDQAELGRHSHDV